MDLVPQDYRDVPQNELLFTAHVKQEFNGHKQVVLIDLNNASDGTHDAELYQTQLREAEKILVQQRHNRKQRASRLNRRRPG